MPTKMRRKANRNAFLAKLMDDEVRVIDSIAFAQPKTKDFQAFLASVKVDRSALIALPMDSDKSRNAMLSGRNVDGVTIVRSDQINAFNMLNHRYMVIGRAELEAWLSGPSSQTTKDAKINPLGRKADASKGGK
jgi:large subunit ribosomal protein L4